MTRSDKATEAVDEVATVTEEVEDHAIVDAVPDEVATVVAPSTSLPIGVVLR